MFRKNGKTLVSNEIQSYTKRLKDKLKGSIVSGDYRELIALSTLF